MYLIILAWLYVTLLMALVEAFSTQGTVLGAIIGLFVMRGIAGYLADYNMAKAGRGIARDLAGQGRECRTTLLGHHGLCAGGQQREGTKMLEHRTSIHFILQRPT